MAKTPSPWLELVKSNYKAVTTGGKFKGPNAMKEAMRLSKESWAKMKKENKPPTLPK